MQYNKTLFYAVIKHKNETLRTKDHNVLYHILIMMRSRSHFIQQGMPDTCLHGRHRWKHFYIHSWEATANINISKTIYHLALRPNYQLFWASWLVTPNTEWCQIQICGKSGTGSVAILLWNFVIIGLGSDLSPFRCKANVWANADYT